jgi:hypothetical protein
MVVKKEMNGFELCAKHQIPVQVSMGGGYSPDIKTIIEAHANTYRVAKVFSKLFQYLDTCAQIHEQFLLCNKKSELLVKNFVPNLILIYLKQYFISNNFGHIALFTVFIVVTSVC